MASGATPPRFDLVVIGHITQDVLLEGGWRPGGTAAYAARVALDLGLRVAVVTSGASLHGFEDVFEGAEVFFTRSAETTSFANRYRGSQRTQYLLARAVALGCDLLPREVLDARAVLLGPVMGEVPWTMARAFSPQTRVAACVQGWLREADREGNVRRLPRTHIRPETLRGLCALFMSEEDVGGKPEAEATAVEWAPAVNHLVMTAAEEGSTLYSDDRRLRVSASPVPDAVDPTGAGDAYAAGFLARLLETGDAAEAAAFAAATASLMVEQLGIGRIDKSDVMRRFQSLGRVRALPRASHG